MPKNFSRFLFAAALLFASPLALADDAPPTTYDAHAAAIFKRHCLQCHGDSKQEAGLSLASYGAALKGGSGGPVVVSGRSSASRLFQSITAEDAGERMPPDNDPLPKEQIAAIKAWIDGGLRENAGSAAAPAPTTKFTPSAGPASGAPGATPEALPTLDPTRTARPFPILALAASPRADVVAASGYERVEFVDPKTRSSLGAVAFPIGEPHVLRFSRSGAVLLAAGGRPVQNGAAWLFDVKSGRKLAELGDETDAVLAADLAADERRAAIGGSGRVVKIYSTLDGRLLHTLVKHTDWITGVAFSPDGKLLASADRVGNIHLWDAESGGVVLPLAEHKGAVRALAWRSDSKILASCGEDGQILWWDVEKGWPAISKPNAHPPKRPAGVFGAIPNGVLDAQFGPRGELVTCGRDGLVRLWSDDGTLLQTFTLEAQEAVLPGVSTLPLRATITHDGARVLAGDSAGRIHSWTVETK